ncbi:hypothetical protein [Streptomyces sp. 11-1-2]|uniref:hypothetical protein n=1 Tax=unclassified Streptomyces TaxID=2593676 RepID=UPI000B8D8A04|nr:hypothetical protein [Streptomyces sp. 11-1-2]ASQ99717.1 hypothetical protein CGL27_47965 [Streptomyces sp. 11-1-2]
MNSLVRERREPGELFGPRFSLFADMLAIGLATAVASLPLVTAPVALAAACTVLRGAVREDRPATLGRYVAELRTHRPLRSLLAGATVLAALAFVGVDLMLAGAGLPGARSMSWALSALAAAALVVALRTAAAPDAARGRRPALRRAAARSAADLPGCGLLATAVALCVVLLWMLPLLAPLLPGPLALAITAVELRNAPSNEEG